MDLPNIHLLYVTEEEYQQLKDSNMLSEPNVVLIKNNIDDTNQLVYNGKISSIVEVKDPEWPSITDEEIIEYWLNKDSVILENNYNIHPLCLIQSTYRNDNITDFHIGDASYVIYKENNIYI